jgi:hypothetical protein
MYEGAVRVWKVHRRNKNTVWFWVSNGSDVAMELVRKGEKGPEQLSLGTREMVLVKGKVEQGTVEEVWEYEVKNLVVKPGEGLMVKVNVGWE